MVQDIPKSYITCISIACLTVIAVAVLIMQTNHLLLETLIMIIGGLAGYQIKGVVDRKVIQELEDIIDDLRGSKS